MIQELSQVMTSDPVTLPTSASILDAAQCMRAQDIGDVIVTDGGRMCGILTDRDIVVRAIAQGLDPATTTIAEVCSEEVVSLAPVAKVEEAVHVMREKALRRLPVTEDGKPVGVVSLGDLALHRDRDSALADISAAPPNQ
jgi:CBS domain-containing protein